MQNTANWQSFQVTAGFVPHVDSASLLHYIHTVQMHNASSHVAPKLHISEVIQYVNTAPRGLCPLICGMIDRESSSWLLALGKHLNHCNRFCLIFCVINVRDRVLRLASTFTGLAQLWATNLSDDFIYRSPDHRADDRCSQRGLCLYRTKIEPTSDSPALSHCQIGPYRDSPCNTSSRATSCDGQAGSLVQMSTLHVLMNYDWVVEQPIATAGS